MKNSFLAKSGAYQKPGPVDSSLQSAYWIIPPLNVWVFFKSLISRPGLYLKVQILNTIACMDLSRVAARITA